MLPDEALLHADAVVVGDAEGIWETVLADAAAGRLQRLYRSTPGNGGRRSTIAASSRQALRADRARASRPRLPLHLRLLLDPRVLRHVPRRSAIRTTSSPRCARCRAAAGVLRGRQSLRRPRRLRAPAARAHSAARRWCCQITIDVAKDDALLDLMAAGRLRARADRLRVPRARRASSQMRKKWNDVAGSYEDVIRRFHARGIMIYGTFVFGYDADMPASFDRAAAFAREQSLCIANFNPLTPMPGTALYDRLRARGTPAARRLVARSGLSLRRLHLRAALHDDRRAARGPMRARRALLPLALDPRARCARHADVAQRAQARNHAARQLDLAPRDLPQAGRPLAAAGGDRAGRGVLVKLTLIKPTIGRMAHSLYVDEARMEPLNLGVLAALTPPDVDVVMYDDRMEPIPYHDADRSGRHHRRDLHRAPLVRDRRRVSPPRRARGDGRLPAHVRAGRMRATRRRALHRRRRDAVGHSGRGRAPRRSEAAVPTPRPGRRRPAS